MPLLLDDITPECRQCLDERWITVEVREVEWTIECPECSRAWLDEDDAYRRRADA